VSDYKSFIKEVVKEIPDLCLSFEVISDDFYSMEKEAKTIAGLGENIYVKIPVTNTKGELSSSLINSLSSSGIKINATVLYDLDQVKSVVDALSPETPSIVSVFAGRIGETGIDPIPIVKQSYDLIKTKPLPKSELLWAATREIFNIFQAEECGCSIITIGYDLDSNKRMIERLSEYATVEKQDTLIQTDVFIQCTMYPVKGHFIESKKKILWVHCIPFVYPDSILEDKEFVADVDKVVCVSDYCTNLVKKAGYEAITIHNDFDVDFIRAKANEYITEEYDYCYVGRLSTEKGTHRIQKLAKANRQKKIAVVGCGYEHNELMMMQLNQPNITLVGAKENPYPYMKNSKFTLLLSNYESWGNVITESLIIGTPVIATNFDTATEQITDGVNGWIIEKDSTTFEKIKPITIEPYNYKSNWEKWIEIIDE